MNKFSKVLKGEIKINKDESEIKYNGYLKIIGYKDYEFVKEDDVVVVLPYLVDEASILLRSEYIPTYQYFYKNYNDYSFTSSPTYILYFLELLLLEFILFASSPFIV